MRQQTVTIKISPQKFRGILSSGYTTDLIFLLSLIDKGLDITGFDMPKEKAMLQTLIRKQLTNEQYKITTEGKILLDYFNSKDEKDGLKLSKLSISKEPFDIWWKAYPRTDAVIKDKKILIKGSRSLYNDKDGCRIKYNKIILEGDYTPEQLLKALLYEVKLKVDRSIRERKNYMTYMKNTHAYLNQRSFEGFIEEAEIAGDSLKSTPSPETSSGIVGI